MRLALFLAGVEAGALQNNVHADLAPGQVGSVLLAVDLDLFAVHDDGSVLRFDGVTLIAALCRVILEQMRKHLRIGQIVDRNDLIPFGTEHLTECQTTDTAKTIDCNFNCHNNEPPNKFF